jgi:hypothetical protein
LFLAAQGFIACTELFQEFDFRALGDGRSASARYANNSNYRNDSLIRKESMSRKKKENFK